MLNKFIAWLNHILRRLENLQVGAVEDAMAPLKHIHDELAALETRASAAEAKARSEAFALMEHAGTQASKVYAARAKIEKLKSIIG
jgi:hypothetical protein